MSPGDGNGDAIAVRRDGAVAVVTIRNPPVNALSFHVREPLGRALAALRNDPEVEAVVLACAGRTFAAGADIKEFGKPPLQPDLRALIALLEDLTIPSVAAIHGTALGGGLELALGCSYRVASSDARLGLPEVKLGLLPGAGGTLRLPALIGPAEALAMIVSGEPIDASRALALGLVDDVAGGDLLAAAIAFARARAAENARPAPVRDRRDRIAAADLADLDRRIGIVVAKARGLEAPVACAEAVWNAATRDPAEATSALIFDWLCEQGRFGQKSGRGFYLHGADRARTPNPELQGFVERRAAECGIERRAIEPGEIVERTHFPLVNEGARIIEEGIAASASDIDLVWVHGYGFPRGRGGPMHWAERIGFGRIAARLDHWHEATGREIFRASNRLRRMASEAGA